MTDTHLFGYTQPGGLKLGCQYGGSSYALNEEIIPSLTWLLQNVPAGELLDRLSAARGDELTGDFTPTLRGLFDRQPIWASGVTYKISEEARERESDNSTIYTRVYHAKRPEIFLKSMGYEVVSSEDVVGIRADATWSVPEPELTVVLNRRQEIIGFTIGNDMSSRDIEGANPLYLPQAKIYQSA